MKLLRCCSHGPLDAIILLSGDAVVVKLDQAPAGDGDAVDVALDIARHFFGATDRPFAVNDPFGLAERCEVSGKRLRLDLWNWSSAMIIGQPAAFFD